MTTKRVEELIRRIEPDHAEEVLLDSDDIPTLTEFLQSGDPYLAERAASLLGLVQDDKAAEPLAAALDNDNEPVRIAAARSLTRLPNPPADPVKRALEDASPAVRRFTIRGLAQRLDTDPPDAHREWMKPLSDLADHASDPVSAALAQMLTQRLSNESLTSSDILKAFAAGATPTDIGTVASSSAGDALIDIVESADDPIQSASAVEASATAGAEVAGRVLRAAMPHPDAAVRVSAARVLQRNPDLKDESSLLALLRDESPAVRREALVATARAATTVDASAAVDEIAKSDDDKELRDLAKKVKESRGSVRTTRRPQGTTRRPRGGPANPGP